MLPYLFSNSTIADADQVNANFAILGATGKVSFHLGTTPPAGHLLLNGYTIGDATSGGSARANADTEELFALIWASFANVQCPIYTSTGAVSTRGASASADYGAHKRLALPSAVGKTIMMYDAGQAEFNVFGFSGGAKTHTLVEAEMPSHFHSVDPPATNSGTVSADHVHYDAGHVHQQLAGSSGSGVNTIAVINRSVNFGVNNTGTGYASLGGMSANHYHATDIAAFNSASKGSGGAHNNLSPYIVLNAIVKI